MTLWGLVWRSIRHYRGSSLAIVAGLAVATAVITGSLVIGSSLHGSLLDLSLARLGGVHYAAVPPRAVSDSVVAGSDALPLLQTIGTATPAQGEPNPVGVTVWGVDEDFVRLQGLPALPAEGALVNASVARDLGLQAGDEIALSVNRPQAIGLDSLFARRKLADVMGMLQLPLAAVLPDNGPGDFRLDGQSARPRNIFIPREALARTLDMAGQANVLVAPVQSGDAAALTAALASRLTLADHGLNLRQKPSSLSLTSAGFTLTQGQATTAKLAATQLGASVMETSAYLATTIRTPAGRETAYAIVAGISEPQALGLDPKLDRRTPAWIALNSWAAEDLQAQPGAVLTLEYLVPSPGGSFPQKSLQARLVAVVPVEGMAADAHLMPEYEGLTDAVTLGSWKPPFPVDMGRITERDDEYWERYKTTPKAFVSMAVAQKMWGEAFGLTSLEITPPQGADSSHIREASVSDGHWTIVGGRLGDASRTGVGGGQAPAQFAAQYEANLREHLQSGQPVIAFRDMARQAREASSGTTDFSQLFLALSMFIIAAGAGLAAMLVRLGVERRRKQIGLMLAIGLTAAKVRRLLLSEGMMLSLGGVLAGLPPGVLYAAGLLGAMRVFWRAAVGDAPALWLHVSALDLLVAAIGGLLVGGLTVLLTLRGLGRLEPVQVWQEGLEATMRGPRLRLRRSHPATGVDKPARRQAAGLIVIAAGVLGLLVWAATDAAAPRAIAFFGAGFLLLVGGLMGLNLALTRPRELSGLRSLHGLAWRNASQSPRRSLLVCGLIASATFVIIATATSTRDMASTDTFDRAGPSGGFNLLASSQVPLPYDPATPEGRRNLGVNEQDEAVLARATIVSMLASPGDDLSCVNSARPRSPQLLASDELALWSGQRFGDVLVMPDIEGLSSGVSAATDLETLQWRLYKRSGDLWETQDIHGRPLHLRLDGGFTRSIFAGHLLVSDGDMRRIYPEVSAPSFFLIETAPQDEAAVTAALRRSLGDLGLQVRPSREVLAEYAAINNVYISMFLALGALGLLLGTVGLAVVTVRNVIERRAELALLAATGFARSRVRRLLLMEHGGLLVAGLALGMIAALVAMLPQLLSPESSVNWIGLAVAMLAVLIVGIGTNMAAIGRSVDDDLVAALRHE